MGEASIAAAEPTTVYQRGRVSVLRFPDGRIVVQSRSQQAEGWFTLFLIAPACGINFVLWGLGGIWIASVSNYAPAALLVAAATLINSFAFMLLTWREVQIGSAIYFPCSATFDPNLQLAHFQHLPGRERFTRLEDLEALEIIECRSGKFAVCALAVSERGERRRLWLHFVSLEKREELLAQIEPLAALLSTTLNLPIKTFKAKRWWQRLGL